MACWYDQPELLSNLLKELPAADLRVMQEARDTVVATQNGETPYQLAEAEGATRCMQLLEEVSYQITTLREQTLSDRELKPTGRRKEPKARVYDPDESQPLPQMPKDSYRCT